MSARMDQFFSVYEDFAKIHIEFVAISSEMPKVTGKLMVVPRKSRKTLKLIFDNNNP